MCVHFRYGLHKVITRSFSWKLASATSVLIEMFHTRHAFALRHPDLPGCQLPRLHQLFQQLDRLACSVTPSPLCRYGNLYPLSIDYACRPRLRSRLTQSGRTFLWKPWVFGAWDSHPRAATHTGILSSSRSTYPFDYASSLTGTLPYHLTVVKSIASVLCLAPVNFRRRVIRLVSCYALFKGWLLLSQPPSCLYISTSFST